VIHSRWAPTTAILHTTALLMPIARTTKDRSTVPVMQDIQEMGTHVLVCMMVLSMYICVASIVLARMGNDKNKFARKFFFTISDTQGISDFYFLQLVFTKLADNTSTDFYSLL